MYLIFNLWKRRHFPPSSLMHSKWDQKSFPPFQTKGKRTNFPPYNQGIEFFGFQDRSSEGSFFTELSERRTVTTKVTALSREISRIEEERFWFRSWINQLLVLLFENLLSLPMDGGGISNFLFFHPGKERREWKRVEWLLLLVSHDSFSTSLLAFETVSTGEHVAFSFFSPRLLTNIFFCRHFLPCRSSWFLRMCQVVRITVLTLEGSHWRPYDVRGSSDRSASFDVFRGSASHIVNRVNQMS